MTGNSPQAAHKSTGCSGGAGGLTLAEVGEDVVHAELGSSRTHLGVAIAEAAATAGRVVGLQVEGARATPEKEAGHARGPNEPARLRGAQLD